MRYRLENIIYIRNDHGRSKSRQFQPNIGISDECQRTMYTLSNDGTVYAEWSENPNLK